MNINYLASKNVAILGMGIEGVALASYLIDKSASVTLLDCKSQFEIETSLPASKDIFLDKRYVLNLGESYLSDLNKFDVIFRSPGIRYLLPEIQEASRAGVIISSQIKLFFDLCPAKIIGVTGTKGKGTTSSLIYEIMKKNDQIRMTKSEKPTKTYLAGNIGTPAISFVDELKENDWVILELSSFQLQDLHKSPHIAVVLNISSDHLDYHTDEVEYHEAKLSIVKFQQPKDFAIVNMDYLTSFKFASATDAKCYYFSGNKSVDDGAYVRATIGKNNVYEVVCNIGGQEKIVCKSNEIKLFGRHNLENIAAATLATSVAGIELDLISEVAKDFKGLPHRLEFVREISGVKIFNDSFSTNPDPTMAAVRAFKEPKLLILGGSTKGADFDEMGKEISESDVKAIALIGDEADNIGRSLKSNNFDGEIYDSGYDLNSAIASLFKVASRGDVLIFSPACASFDMFKNYKNRGEVFKEAVASFDTSNSKILHHEKNSSK